VGTTDAQLIAVHVQDAADDSSVGAVITAPAASAANASAPAFDAVAPVTSLAAAAPASPSASTSATFAGFGTTKPSSDAIYECQLDGSTWNPCTDGIALTGLADGAHTFRVRAVDDSGNVDPSPPTRNWTVDSRSPETSITTTPEALAGREDRRIGEQRAGPARAAATRGTAADPGHVR
jgi:hypothetical protein